MLVRSQKGRAIRSALLLLQFASASAQAVLSGHVVAVKSGAELTVKLDTGQSLAVQLAAIEAPVPTQPVFARASLALTRLALNQRAELVAVPAQPGVYRVRIGAVDISTELLKRGLAWVDRRAVSDRNLFTFEAQARTAHRGIWRDPHPVPPHEWQAGKRPAPIREADLSGLIIGDTYTRFFTPANCPQPLVAPEQRLLFAREQDAIAAGLRRRNCR